MSNYFRYRNNLFFHPGYFIEDFIRFYGITQEDFALRLDITSRNLGLLIRGEQSLSPEMARRLSAVTNTSTELWTNIQKEYDEMKDAAQSQQNGESTLKGKEK